MIDVLWLHGTGHGSTPDGVSETFGAALDAERFRFRAVEYPADYGDVLSLDESVAAGQIALAQAVDASPNLAVIGGYSQGALAAGNLAAEIADGKHPTLEVLACALIADPLRPAGATAPGMTTASGFGISGQRPVGKTVPTFWAANEGDPITSIPAGDPLRTVADLSQFMAATLDPVRARDLADKTWFAMVAGGFQRWWDLSNWRSWLGAVAYARGFVYDGRHTDDYIRRGLCATLADVVNEHVRL